MHCLCIDSSKRPVVCQTLPLPSTTSCCSVNCSKRLLFRFLSVFCRFHHAPPCILTCHLRPLSISKRNKNAQGRPRQARLLTSRGLDYYTMQRERERASINGSITASCVLGESVYTFILLSVEVISIQERTINHG